MQTMSEKHELGMVHSLSAFLFYLLCGKKFWSSYMFLSRSFYTRKLELAFQKNTNYNTGVTGLGLTKTIMSSVKHFGKLFILPDWFHVSVSRVERLTRVSRGPTHYPPHNPYPLLLDRVLWWSIAGGSPVLRWSIAGLPMLWWSIIGLPVQWRTLVNRKVKLWTSL